MQEEFTAKLTGRFVDDDDIVRTGRAMLELDGFNMLHLPIPDGYKEQLDDLFGKAGVSAEAAKKSASAAGASAADAKKSETAAASSASSAKTSASGAASSASSASSSEKKAADSAKAATSAQESVTASASLAQESAAKAGVSEKAAASSASSASTDASKAAASEKNAAASASSAKTDADRVSKIAESTSWNGDKLTVNGKTSPSLRGPKGDPGDPGQDGKDGASEWSEIDDKPATFPPAEHTHVIGDTTGLQAALDGKADKGHLHGIADVDGLSARLAGIDSAVAGKASAADMVAEQQKPRVWPVTGNLGAEPVWPAGSRTGDLLLNTQTLELWKVGSGLIAQLSRTSPQKLGAVDFNTLQTSGVWIQNATADAQVSTNNPINAAGLIEVSAAFGMVYQRFTYFWDTQVYVRRLYDDSWSPWKKLTME